MKKKTLDTREDRVSAGSCDGKKGKAGVSSLVYILNTGHHLSKSQPKQRTNPSQNNDLKEM